jgi:LAO/AO transport system kinase
VEIVKSIAAWGLRDGSGIDDLLRAIGDHRTRISGGPEGASRAEARAAAHLAELIKGLLADRASRGVEALGGLGEVAREVASRALDPYTAAEQIVDRV